MCPGPIRQLTDSEWNVIKAAAQAVTILSPFCTLSAIRMPSDTVMFYGPILLGGSVALMLSGIVAVQCIIFFKLYPDEAVIKTLMVATVWLLDVAQSGFILVSLFFYLVQHFGDGSVRDVIPWSISLSLLFTALQTLVVHLFYAQKIYKSSGRSWLITGPVATLACLRLGSAVVSTSAMLKIGRWSKFGKTHFLQLFTVGLSMSAGTDLLITLLLCYYLRKIRKRSSSSVMKGVLDTLTLYTLENGLITCLATVGALTFWLVIPHSSLSLSLHFVIGKLYPNSLLVLLNTRKELREIHGGDQGIQVNPADHLKNYYTHFPHRAPGSPQSSQQSIINAYRPQFKLHKPSPLEINVRRTVERDSTEIVAPDNASHFYYSSHFDHRRPFEARSLRSQKGLYWPSLP
ncbi:hypothetical protein C8J57DRAFT_1599206 [Mycena rebaudengoi]|nr:hypothetical protein C8J57DRAFT_1599206 [Mycena rebaudengoi]